MSAWYSRHRTHSAKFWPHRAVDPTLRGLHDALCEEAKAAGETRDIAVDEVHEGDDCVFMFQVSERAQNSLPDDLEFWSAEGPPQPGGRPAWSGPVMNVDTQAGMIVVRWEEGTESPLGSAKIILRPPDYLRIVRDWALDLLHAGRVELPDWYERIEHGEVWELDTLRDLQKWVSKDVGLRPAQQIAVRHAGKPVSLIWGPPGTGKTYTLGAVAAALSMEGVRVLILGPTNVAVDQAAIAVDDARRRIGYPLNRGELIRPGNPALPELSRRRHLLRWTDDLRQMDDEISELRTKIRQREHDMPQTGGEARRKAVVAVAELKKRLDDLKGVRSQRLWKLAHRASIIVTTLTAAFHHRSMFEKERIGALVFDEASMIPRYVAAPWLEDPPEHLVICGDIRQLPPIKRNPHPNDENARHWCGESLFALAGARRDEDLRRIEELGGLTLLDTQSRMTEELCRNVSEVFYFGRLKTIHPPAKPPVVAGWPDRSMLVVDPTTTKLPPDSPPGVSRQLIGSDSNEATAHIAVGLAGEVLQADRKAKVLILTPYRKQKRLLRTLVRAQLSSYVGRVASGTVHVSQGQEADLVIFDMVNPLSTWLTGQWGDGGRELICVAFSRARRQMIVIAEPGQVARNPICAPLVEDAIVWNPRWTARLARGREK